MTSYQSKLAKARIEKKLTPIASEPESKASIEPEKPKLPPTPARANDSFLDAFAELF